MLRPRLPSGDGDGDGTLSLVMILTLTCSASFIAFDLASAEVHLLLSMSFYPSQANVCRGLL